MSIIRRVLVTAVILSGVTGGVVTVTASSIPELLIDNYEFTDRVEVRPLIPPDTSSPQATLQTFIENMNLSYRIASEADHRNRNAPGFFADENVRKMTREAEKALDAAEACLDLTEIPPAFAKVGEDSAALHLKEIFDRIELPPLDEVPGAEDVPEIESWRIPNTEIDIVRMTEGDKKGQYIFSARTVSRLREFYAEVEDLPYNRSAVTSPGFLDFYIITPGQIVPPKWTKWVPSFMTAHFLEQTFLQWFLLLAYIVPVIIILIVVNRIIRTRSVNWSPTKRSWFWVVYFTLFCGAFFGYFFLETSINITGSVLIYTRFVLSPIGWFFLGVWILLIARALAESIISSPRIDSEGVQASYLRAIFNVVGFVATIAIIVYGLTRIGLSLVPLVAGLGIGGFAIAIAARPMLEGIIGSFLIFADNPYKVGQRIIVNGHDGIVESIGLRSTRLRLLNGHQASIPNEKMVAADIENIGRRPFIRRLFSISITYDTPPDKMRRAVEIIKDILSVPDEIDTTLPEPPENPGDEPEKLAHPNIPVNQPDFPPRVFFNDLTSDSQNVMVIYWYHPPNYWDYLEHAQNVNLLIRERFAAKGIKVAFPTQTLHLKTGTDGLETASPGNSESTVTTSPFAESPGKKKPPKKNP